MDEKFQETCSNIRACLSSSKKPCSLSELIRDYRSVLGESIPYQALGFPSLEACIRKVPQLKINRIGNELFIDVKPDEKTAHISNLVRGQKTAKKKTKKKSNYYGGYRSAPPRHPFDYASQRKRQPPPPPRSNDYYPSRRNDPPTYRKPSPTPIIISSEEDEYGAKGRNQRPYRFSQPTPYDFSDPNEEGSDYDDVIEINDKMEALKVTLGKERQVSVNKPKFRGYYSSTSVEDDYGYSSMNEVNISNESKNDDTSNEKGDKAKRSMTREPATFLAAGRAMQEPNIEHDTTQSIPKKNQIERNSTGDFKRERQPFQKINIASTSPVLSGIKGTSNASSVSSLVNLANHSGGSKMSDPNMFKPGPVVQPNFSDGYCSQLLIFTGRHNLQQPVFKTFTKYCPKTKEVSYMCKVKIGSSLSFSSCPYESKVISEIHQYTAKLAYEELQRRYENLGSQTLPITQDENLIIKRIAEIVNPHSNGLKCESIEMKYKIVHQEILPLKWLDIIKNRSLLSVEELVGGNIAVYPIEGVNAQSDVSKLPPLILPESNVWNVFVTYCMSTSGVYFRIIHDDYNGRYVAMDERMTDLYFLKKDELKPVNVVKAGSYYAAYLDQSWFRVKALSTVVDDCVRVSLIDHGEIDDVSKENLYPLDERFTNVPPQKVSCSLTGLEEYAKDMYVTKMVYELTVGKVFVATIDSRNPNLQLTLVDTSTEVDIDVNELIRDRIDKELTVPKIPSQNNVADAYLVSVKEDGLAFVQIISDSYNLLKSFLTEASQELASDQNKFCIKSSSELVGNKIFLARYAQDGEWYRVLINQVVSDDQIEVLFVDYGNLEVVKMSDIADTKYFEDALVMIPHQAIQVRLARPTDELFTEDVLQLIMDFSLPKEKEEPTRYILKTIKESVISDVQLFLRYSDSNEFVNLNDIIAAYFPDYRDANKVTLKVSTVKTNVPKKNIRKPPSKETMERIYPIPIFHVPVNGQFVVFVEMVSNPFNFVVQPYEQRSQLITLMDLMKKFYDAEQPLVDVASIRENEVYAVKTDSGKWYRGIVVKIFSGSDCVSMRLIDYGNVELVKLANIAPLLPLFRELPGQALRAELAGVAPLNIDWTVEDSLRFKNLTSQKVLISYVVDVNVDGKISILLYDTSSDREIDIGAVLVEEKRAKDITNTC